MSKTTRKATKGSSQKVDNQLGEFLARARQKKNLTLVEVAEELGLKSGQSVWDWENGKGSGIPADMLLKLTRIYGLPAEKAYDQLLRFHQSRTEQKVLNKFNQAKLKVFGKK